MGSDMPWRIQKKGDKWLVVKEEDGKVVGTHPSREKALAHLRALYANVPEARKEAKKKK